MRCGVQLCPPLGGGNLGLCLAQLLRPVFAIVDGGNVGEVDAAKKGRPRNRQMGVASAGRDIRSPSTFQVSAFEGPVWNSGRSCRHSAPRVAQMRTLPRHRRGYQSIRDAANGRGIATVRRDPQTLGDQPGCTRQALPGRHHVRSMGDIT
jgi:hypothetical protein